MIVFDGVKLIGLAIGLSILAVCAVILIVDRIICTVKKKRR